jgi:xylulokinase
MYLLGYDIGSSTIKAALIDVDTHKCVGLVQYPDQDMDMISRQIGWAEQQPEVWWQNVCFATKRLLSQTGVKSEQIVGIGISYQMHGLVLIDEEKNVLRPAIIWCDSRAVSIGDQAFTDLGKEFCLHNYLNSPGNFTASKMKWIIDNEPEVYDKCFKMLLPGDYIAMKLTGEVQTTTSGLTEGILWDYRNNSIAKDILKYFHIEESMIPSVVDTFSIQGRLTKEAANLTGLTEGTPLCYRAGDQPNNALSLNVLNPGEIAATSGTSGVVYGVVDRLLHDEESRVNAFAHVNHTVDQPSLGMLLCINGAGIEYHWVKHQISLSSRTYDDMERMASTVPIGSGGVCILPFGNGSERIFQNKNINSHIFNLQFNRHTRAHLYRASLEGVAFSFVHGITIMKDLGLKVDLLRVGNDNMFRSKIFSTTIATLLDSHIEVVDTTGAIGAAKAAGVACHQYHSLAEALTDTYPSHIYEPSFDSGLCQQSFGYWSSALEQMLFKSYGQTNSSRRKKEDLSESIKEKTRLLTKQSLKIESQNKLIIEMSHILSNYDQIPKQDLKAKIKMLTFHAGNTVSEDDDNWNTFEKHFDLLSSDFISTLKEKHPNLKIEDMKLCTLIRTGLTSKDIANQLNLSNRGIETRRYRLKKKLKLKDDDSVSDYLMSL